MLNDKVIDENDTRPIIQFLKCSTCEMIGEYLPPKYRTEKALAKALGWSYTKRGWKCGNCHQMGY